MVIDELLALSVGHLAERVVLSLELAIESREASDDLLLNFSSLLSSDCSSERVVSEVTSNTNSGRVDHFVLVGWEVGASKLGVIHVHDVLVRRRVSVVVRDDLVEQRSKSVETFVTASVNTDSGVGPFGSRENAFSEGVAVLVLAVLALLPHIASEALREERGSSAGEVWEGFDVLWGLQV
jgi:hypothetical protein